MSSVMFVLRPTMHLVIGKHYPCELLQKPHLPMLTTSLIVVCRDMLYLSTHAMLQ
jgi:hypothetical protein